MRIRKDEKSFALISTLLIVAVMALGALAFFQTARMDRLVSRNTADRLRADLAAESGQAAAAALLRQVTANDHFLVVLNPTNRQLFAGNGSNQAVGAFAYQPLWSFTSNLTNLVAASITNGLPTFSNAASVTNLVVSLPRGVAVTSPSVAWVNLTNAAGQTNARFAFWMEDLAGRLDLSVAGSTGTNASRPTGTNPAELALWSLFNPGSSLDSNNPTVQSLVNSRSALLTPATARLASASVTTNLLIDLAVGLIHDTNEPDLVPYGFGYANQGQPKTNLNQAITNANALNLIVSQITNNLPNFTNRAGGMNGQVYAYALAADIIDYADANDDATSANINGVRIQGFDNYPYLTQLFDQLTYANNPPSLTISTYLQFWNLSSRTNNSNNVNFVYNFNDTIRYLTNLAVPNGFATSRVTMTPLSFTFSMPAIPPNSGLVAAVTTNIPLSGLANFPTPGPLNVSLNQAINGSQQTATNQFSLSWGSTTSSNAIGMARIDRFLNSGNPTNMGSVFGLRTYFAATLINPVDPRMLPYLGLGSTTLYDHFDFNNVVWKGYPAATNLNHSGNPALWLEGKGSAFASNGPSAVTNPVAPTLPGAFSIFPNSPPALLSPTNQYLSVTELGRVLDPMQWRPPTLTTNDFAGLNISTNWVANNLYGGGTTLRIGRPEHSAFTNDGLRAAQLLDLFAVGPRTANGGATVLNSVAGRINLNTATTNTLRALAAGVLHTNDPNLLSGGTAAGSTFVIPTNAVTSFVFGVTNFRAAAPFDSPSQLTLITRAGQPVFGNSTNTTIMGSANLPLVWNDAAAEEWFSKVYPLCTVRSRNFMIYVVAQALATNSGRPLASVTRAFQVYAEPLRDPNTGLTTNVNVRTLQSWSP